MFNDTDALACENTGQALNFPDIRSMSSAGRLASGNTGYVAQAPARKRVGVIVCRPPWRPRRCCRVPRLRSRARAARQLRLLANDSMSAVPYGELRDLAKAQLRRECRRWDFDWDAYVADGPEWGITEVVHRRAVQRERGRGLDLRPTDIPTDTVLSAVRDVIAEWTDQPELRPTYDDFRQEQARRGEKGRETQQALAVSRNAEILSLVAEGFPDAEIARRVGLHRSQVGRVRRAAATTSTACRHRGHYGGSAAIPCT